MIKIPKIPPTSGMLLISSVNMLDQNFSRSVIFICDHKKDGSFGLVLNQPLPLKLSDIVNSVKGWDAPLYRGGPVQENTLHFLHKRPDLDINSYEILPGVFWGGDFDTLNEKLSNKEVSISLFDIHFLSFKGAPNRPAVLLDSRINT